MLQTLRPLLALLASEIASQCADDAQQEAEIAIWEVVTKGKVNVERSHTIRAFLVRVSKNAMRDCVKQHRTQIKEDFSGTLADQPGRSDTLRSLDLRLDIEHLSLPGVFDLYRDAVKENGGLDGCQTFVASQCGVKRATACTWFHQMAREVRSTVAWHDLLS